MEELPPIPSSNHLTTINYHLHFLEAIEKNLFTICSNHSSLSYVVPMLKCCSPDAKFNNFISDHLMVKSQHRNGAGVKIFLHLINDRIEPIYFRSKTINVEELRRTIERDISIRLQILSQNEKRFLKKLFRKLDWNNLWRKYDLLINQTDRIDLERKTHRMHREIRSREDYKLKIHLEENMIVRFVPKHKNQSRKN
ncbi:hypothetical protein SSS_02275 [Sarcoptes scabiei]|uniref:Uncharacterized protein n=1 Tax=Sarcoptes scabiei TaxID=52283 RepID=A0A834RBY0_SARSC|nr:hypothetical protein SSS_02275 [Sarcoptes scabiei]